MRSGSQAEKLMGCAHTAVHDDDQPCCFCYSPGLLRDDPKLKPEHLCSDCNGLPCDLGSFLGGAKHLYHVNWHINLSERAEHGYFKDLDVVADDPLAIKHHVERQAEVLPVDLTLGAVTDAVAHIGIIEFPIPHHVQRHRPGVALDGQVAGHGVAILSSRFDPGALEGERRILVDFQKIR